MAAASAPPDTIIQAMVSAAHQNADKYTWGFLPAFDGQTIVSIVLGAVLTIVTFWIGYRKTIGAQDERLRAATSDLCASVIKRVAVERSVITSEQFEAIRRAKAYQVQVQVQKLVTFSSVLDTALLETIDNDFLDSASKQSIINVIDESRSRSVTMPGDLTISANNVSVRASWIAIMSGILGFIASVVSFLFVRDSLVNREIYGFLGSTVLVISILAFVLVISTVSRRDKMERQSPHRAASPGKPQSSP